MLTINRNDVMEYAREKGPDMAMKLLDFFGPDYFNGDYYATRAELETQTARTESEEDYEREEIEPAGAV